MGDTLNEAGVSELRERAERRWVEQAEDGPVVRPPSPETVVAVIDALVGRVRELEAAISEIEAKPYRAEEVLFRLTATGSALPYRAASKAASGEERE